MLMTGDIRGGTVFKVGNDVVVVQRMLGIKGGRNGQVKRLRVKNIITGSTSELGLDMGEKFDSGLHNREFATIGSELVQVCTRSRTCPSTTTP